MKYEIKLNLLLLTLLLFMSCNSSTKEITVDKNDPSEQSFQVVYRVYHDISGNSPDAKQMDTITERLRYRYFKSGIEVQLHFSNNLVYATSPVSEENRMYNIREFPRFFGCLTLRKVNDVGLTNHFTENLVESNSGRIEFVLETEENGEGQESKFFRSKDLGGVTGYSQLKELLESHASYAGADFGYYEQKQGVWLAHLLTREKLPVCNYMAMPLLSLEDTGLPYTNMKFTSEGARKIREFIGDTSQGSLALCLNDEIIAVFYFNKHVIDNNEINIGGRIRPGETFQEVRKFEEGKHLKLAQAHFSYSVEIVEVKNGCLMLPTRVL